MATLCGCMYHAACLSETLMMPSTWSFIPIVVPFRNLVLYENRLKGSATLFVIPRTTTSCAVSFRAVGRSGGIYQCALELYLHLCAAFDLSCARCIQSELLRVWRRLHYHHGCDPKVCLLCTVVGWRHHSSRVHYIPICSAVSPFGCLLSASPVSRATMATSLPI